MKTRKWPFVFMAFLTVLTFSSCQDWGESDPPAGNQIFPTLEKVASLTFDEELIPEEIQTFAYEGGETPTLATDDVHGQVLHLNNGYARISNPLNKVKIQNGVSLTFWMKQSSTPKADSVEKPEQDVKGALFSFQNENGTQRMFFTANGWLNYEGVDGSYEDNNPSDYKTGLMSADEWHYVAVKIRNNGYEIYVDGLKKIDKEVSGFDFNKIIKFMGAVPYIYIGYGSDTPTQEWYIDDLTIYRNQITNNEIKVPGTGGGEEENNYILVGNKDYTTGWWSTFSDVVSMKGNQTIHYGFYNYTNGANNWNNWIVVLSNGKAPGAAGYAEYFVLRADAYGWSGGTSYPGDGPNITHNFNFDTFKTDMQGAYVDMTIKRTDNRIDLVAKITTKAGLTYNYSFYYVGEMEETVGAFLTCEGSYLEIVPETVYAGESYAAGSYRVGPADCSAGWWAYFSKLSVITGNTPSPFVHTFYNYTNGINNWNNWLLVITNGKDRDEAGYAEHLVLRADGFGWGDAYVAANIAHTYNWDTFREQMNGAYCTILLNRTGTRLDLTIKVVTASGEKLGDYTYYTEGITTNNIGIFLLVDGASLDIRTVGYYPFLNKE